LAAVNPDTPSVAQSAPAPDDKPVVDEQESEPASDKPTTGTGPNKFRPMQQSKPGWRPGDLLRQLFPPKTATPTTDTEGSTPSVDPSPSTDTHESTGDAEPGSVA